MVVYVDMIIAVNFAMNSIILYITHRAIRSLTPKWRIPLAALIGAAYTILWYIPGMARLFGFSGRLIFSCIIVQTAFSPRGLKPFAIAVAVFYVMTFAFGGAVYAMLGIVDQNASVAPLWVLVISTILTFIVITVITSRYKRAAAKERSFVDIDITVDGKTTRVQSLVDTGHFLFEPITGRPVIVAEYGKLKYILPNDLGRRMCIIPFRSVGTSDGLMTGFRPDTITVDGEVIKRAVVGIYEGSLSSDGSYFGLIGVMDECM